MAHQGKRSVSSRADTTPTRIREGGGRGEREATYGVRARERDSVRDASIECMLSEIVYVALPFVSALRHSGLAAIV